MSYERHTYDYQIALDADGAPAKVVRMVGQDKRVLEIGAGPGSITKALVQASRCRVTAADIDAQALQQLASICESIHTIDLNQPGWLQPLKDAENFDVLVAADVLEHVYEPLRVLTEMKQLLKPGGSMVISIPHVGHSAVHACLLDEDFAYNSFGLLDRTHIRFFGIKNIQRLFDDAGLRIQHAEFVVRKPEHTEFGPAWSRLPANVREALAGNPFGTVYQVVVQAALAAPSDSPGVQLMALPVPQAQVSGRDVLRAGLRRVLGGGAYARLRQWAARLGMAFKG